MCGLNMEQENTCSTLVSELCTTSQVSLELKLFFFHAFTGSDTTSAFRNKGKKTAWNTWKAFDEATETFANLAVEPFLSIEDDSKEVETLERFVIYMYIKSSPLLKVNDARKEIFCKKKSKHGESSTNKKCTYPAYKKKCVSNWNLGNIF